MQVIRKVKEYRTWRNNLTLQQSLGFVPTMGALHAGHGSLITQAAQENDLAVVSIFVNPTQFGPKEDFASYPRTFEADVEMAQSLGATLIFAPDADEIYPEPPAQITFSIRDLDKVLDGASRPGHMNGVLQVVSILFNIIQPNRAYFGQKDYQQCLLIQQMAQELHIPVEIVPCPIVREPDGLAMSSRNRYLNPPEREQALFLYRTLAQIKEDKEHFRSPTDAKAFVQKVADAYSLVALDYFEILNGTNLKSIPYVDQSFEPVAFIAAHLGETRLIDNMRLWE